MTHGKLPARSCSMLLCRIAICIVPVFASCISARWRPTDADPHASTLPRIDLSIVREAKSNERVGANQIVDGKPYVVEEVRCFPIGEARFATDGFGRPCVTFDVRRDAAAEFESWTEKNVGRSLAMSLKGEMICVAEIQDGLRDAFYVTGGTEGWSLEHVQALIRRFNATDVEQPSDR